MPVWRDSLPFQRMYAIENFSNLGENVRPLLASITPSSVSYVQGIVNPADYWSRPTNSLSHSARDTAGSLGSTLMERPPDTLAAYRRRYDMPKRPASDVQLLPGQPPVTRRISTCRRKRPPGPFTGRPSKFIALDLSFMDTSTSPRATSSEHTRPRSGRPSIFYPKISRKIDLRPVRSSRGFCPCSHTCCVSPPFFVFPLRNG
eukprot:GHVT01044580.1.p1 GENE.GHVT01044580.1~~GHVT01044580.1.p1  ORF type:complete len:203 (-),score=4.15 GHVT01044580.1:135-743(-)